MPHSGPENHDEGTRGLGRPVSGRWFIGGAVLSLLAAWGGLYWAFDGWREGVEARIEFGKREVATTVRPLADVEPPGVPLDQWRLAVAETREMLVEVVGTGRLDRPAMESLRDDLAARVARAAAHPDEAVAIVASIWDDMRALKGLREGLERPAILPPADPPGR